MLNVFGQFKAKNILENLALETFKQSKIGDEKIVNLSFVSASKIRELNYQYRGKNEVTDVLSFKADFFDKDFLGDILICKSQAKKQAKEQGAPFEKEVSLLLVHGILHLAGMRHQTPKDQEKMFSLQDKIISNFFK